VAHAANGSVPLILARQKNSQTSAGSFSTE
jgi:hypothetical protein